MIEQMKQWLEAMKKGVDGQTSIEMDEAITSIRQAIREHAMYEVQRLGQEIEQEPVAHCEIHHLPEPCVQCAKEHEGYNTHPPQRTWVGLTDEDCRGMSAGDRLVAMWADRTLKEKNNA
jgi:hypothetical protein